MSVFPPCTVRIYKRGLRLHFFYQPEYDYRALLLFLLFRPFPFSRPFLFFRPFVLFRSFLSFPCFVPHQVVLKITYFLVNGGGVEQGWFSIRATRHASFRYPNFHHRPWNHWDPSPGCAHILRLSVFGALVLERLCDIWIIIFFETVCRAAIRSTTHPQSSGCHQSKVSQNFERSLFRIELRSQPQTATVERAILLQRQSMAARAARRATIW